MRTPNLYKVPSILRPPEPEQKLAIPAAPPNKGLRVPDALSVGRASIGALFFEDTSYNVEKEKWEDEMKQERWYCCIGND